MFNVGVFTEVLNLPRPHMALILLWFGVLLRCTTLVHSLGTSCTAPLTSGTAAISEPYWLESITHQGTAAYNSDPSTYVVFRNVKDFGAVGDGVTDDTAAINSAISSGDRCGLGTCNSTTTAPALVFFPTGTYLISTPLDLYYYTQLIGDAKNPPTLLASASFAGMAVIDADIYIPGESSIRASGAEWYAPTNNFFRSVRNFVIDLTQIPATTAGTGIHWQVSQSTSLMNIVFEMSSASDTAHQGIWMENGSGGFMGDMVFNGGKYGIWGGNQQFTVRNVSFNSVETAVYGLWNWGYTFQTVTITDCQVGFDLATGGLTEDTQTVGAEAIIDAVVINTPIFVRTSEASTSLAGSIVINNVKLNNVPIAVGVLDGPTVLEGSTGSLTIDSWGQGNVYSGTNTAGTFTQGTIASATKPSSLLDSTGRIVGRMHPQYADYAVSQFVSVKSNGAKGDGSTDDTAALQAIFNEVHAFSSPANGRKLMEIQFSGCAIIFFDAGTYVVTSTLEIPAGTQMVGEAWSVIAGKGSAFENQASPQVVVRVGAEGSSGIMEISDIIFTTVGPTPGAIVVEWNVAEPSSTSAGAGMWDSHIRLGGAAGTNLETAQCPSSGSGGTTNCFAAFLGLHLTAKSTAYLEGTWVWLADHDIDGDGFSQLTLYSGRGILSESAGPVWLIGAGETNHTLSGAQNHYLGLFQTETPYYQPSPAAPTPFTSDSTYNDPITFESGFAWAVNIIDSSDIIFFGAGLYSFYSAYVQTCLETMSCQPQLVNVDSQSFVTIYSLSTVGATSQLSVGNTGIINESANVDGYQSTVTVWSSS
ncbi:exo-beta-1,3-glucanase [Rhodocollybia butyracea]|uniref:Exo-beta-1,3-glucanase n=1 Tax=Rhodocollybia butyracea TaxID=206335 RepID=A0A9P5U871_9AGAR|nr:exo-beta-1,3-glucanase [Rhodocollybia butyracea]